MSQFKKKLTAFSALLTFFAMSAPSLAFSTADVLGTAGDVSVKDTLVNSAGQVTRWDIEMGKNAGEGAFAQIDAQKFNMPAYQHGNIGYSNHAQTVLMRVLGGQESQIFGKLTDSCTNGLACGYDETGKFILINPAGVIFGQGSTVDLNSFTVSTFDMKGAKNLKGMSDADKLNYLNSLKSINPVTGDGKITFDSNYISEFEKAGIDMSKFAGKTQVILAGTKFDQFNEDGSVADRNVNQSIAIISDNIKYKDSLLRTGENLNYTNGYGSGFSLSGVKLVTADGVTFGYLNTGLADGMEIAEDTKTNVSRNIGELSKADEDKVMAAAKAYGVSKELSDNPTSITSGTVKIANKSNDRNSNIKISNMVIKGTKLLNREDGTIEITGNNDVIVDNSRLETLNAKYINENSPYHNQTTINQAGGEIKITAGKNLEIKNTVMKTSEAIQGTGANAEDTSKAANITLASVNGKTDIENTILESSGDIIIDGRIGVDIDNSLVWAYGASDANRTQNIIITSEDDINTHNLVAKAKNNITFKSALEGNLNGNINITGDSDANKDNKSLIYAQDKLSIQGKNTKIDNALLAYDEITFYNDGAQGLNNVTIANNAQFAPMVVKDGKTTIGSDINLETNGNFTMDNASMQIGKFSLKYNDATEVYTTRTAGFTPDNLNVKSTQGDVTAKNNTNVVTNKNITLTADKGNVNTNKSSLKATEEDVNIIASKGAVNIKDNSVIQAGKDVNIKAYETITFGAQNATNVNIDNTSNISAGNDMNVISLAGDINGEKTTMPTLKYGDRLTFNAAGNNNFTSEDSLKAVNVDFIAGKANRFYTNDDIQFVNSTFEAPTNFVESGSDVILNNLTIKQATTNAKDTVTEIYANGNVTTNDVTGTASADVAATTKEFPQSVSTTRTGTGKTVLDINKTKLKITTDTVKDANNPDNGSIKLDVKNADNQNAGLELVAQNVDKLDKDPTGGNFKAGYYKSGTAKWDEKIEPKEGPEVHLNAVDGKVAITNIDTDKLTLDPNDKIIAGKDTKDGSLPTITVKDQGGFNLDPNIGYEPEPDGFTYDKTINSQEIDRKDERIWDEEKGEYIISKSETETVYGKDYVDKTTITTRDTEHEIHFGENGEEEFKLIYDKTDVKVTETPGTITWSEECAPNLTPNRGNVDSHINIIRLPREQVEISKTSKVSDNTVDQTSGVMSAAAKVDLTKAAEATYSNDDDEEK